VVNQIGTLAYDFWIQKMTPLRRRNDDQDPHRESLDYRNLVKGKKLRTYHTFIQAGVISQAWFNIRRLFPLSRLKLFRVLAAYHSSRHPAPPVPM